MFERGHIGSVSTAASLVAICGLAFGPRAVSFEFYRRLLEPPLLYANSFGFWLMLLAAIALLVGAIMRTRGPAAPPPFA